MVFVNMRKLIGRFQVTMCHCFKTSLRENLSFENDFDLNL